MSRTVHHSGNKRFSGVFVTFSAYLATFFFRRRHFLVLVPRFTGNPSAVIKDSGGLREAGIQLSWLNARSDVLLTQGSWDRSVVRAADSTRDWKVAGSNPCRRGGRIFFSRVDFLCWLLFQYPFHPRVTTVARKRSRSFCQKCRWHVTAKHAYTLRMWLCMKWHGAWLYTVYTERAEMAAISCGTSHASAVVHHFGGYSKTRYKKLVTHVESHASAVSLLESGE